MAVEWTFIFRQSWLLGFRCFSARSIDEPAAHQGFGGALVADVRCSLHAPCVAAPDPHVDFNAQLIAWNHGATELGSLNSGEQHQFALAILHLGEEQDSARLSHGLYDQHTRHHWGARRVAGKKGYVDRNVLYGDNPFLTIKIDDAVDQQEWETVRQEALDFIDIQRSLGRPRSVFCRISSIGHSVSR